MTHPRDRYPELAALADRAHTWQTPLTREAAAILDELAALRRGHKQRECPHCDHATVHPCTAAGCSCLCPECGWNALSTNTHLGPCSSPICAHDPTP